MNINSLWKKAIGSPSRFSNEARSTNAVILITLAVVAAFIFALAFSFNLNIFLMLVALTAILIFLYYLSRVRQKPQLSIVLYAFVSYLTLIANYYFNSGINGPTILAFFITYNLLIAITSPRLHLLWAALHIVIAISLVGYEYYYPGAIALSYPTREDRFIDILATYVISLGFVYLITSYLRKSLMKERKLAEKHAQKIEVQNRRISMQNQKLEKVLHERDKLFSIVSHDMLSPLASIQSYLELITSAPEFDEPNMKKELLNLTKNTSGMLRNILTWSKAQVEGVKLDPAVVNVCTIVEHILSVQTSIAAQKQIDIVLQGETKVTAIADEDLLHLIIRNLISNAIKFTPASGTIKIFCGHVNGECCISIEDNGIGMTKDQLDHLFTSETKATYGTENEKGVGLGLHLCNEFIKQLGGRITVTSKLNEGSKFTVYLPRA